MRLAGLCRVRKSASQESSQVMSQSHKTTLHLHSVVEGDVILCTKYGCSLWDFESRERELHWNAIHESFLEVPSYTSRRG
eukprot:scaffold16111_cov152-Skeletonema_dohrnii-CCMP3373.AAC.3